ncbi:MAG TPA: hypothetical protein VGX96_16900 [Candidatus Elarobacter sp.]|nr:hypothetical protein [Candidatus Elarobacter sp.]
MICGDEVLGHWPSLGEAYRTGRRTYGRRLFMVRPIERYETVYFQPVISVGGGEQE